MKISKKISCFWAGIGVLLLLGIDQITKYLASAFLKGSNSIILIKGVFQLHYLENQGAAFGLFQGKKSWFVVITLLVIMAMIVIYLKLPMKKKFNWMRGIIVLLMSGAFGNLLDRIRLDYVIDFFYFELINFPIFNMADIYVCCGVGLLLFLFIFYYKEEDLEEIWPSKKKKNDGI
ncbi:MAG: signal peptidase II [Lachnospiraceae bacterium]